MFDKLCYTIYLTDTNSNNSIYLSNKLLTVYLTERNIL